MAKECMASVRYFTTGLLKFQFRVRNQFLCLENFLKINRTHN